MIAASPAHSVWSYELAEGFSVSGSAVLTPHQHCASSRAGLRLVLLLEGELSLRFAQRPFQLLQKQPHSAEVLLLNLREEEQFERLYVEPGMERKICMHIPADWLQEHGLSDANSSVALRAFTQRHLASAQWRLDGRLTQLATRLLPLHHQHLLARLQRDSSVLELLAGLLEKLQPASSAAPAHIHRRMQQVRELLESGEADDWSMADVASFACMSSTTLQRHFRRSFDQSLFEYLRQQRLLRARDKLRQEGWTISAAALEAGYTSPANFATAFRRAFGISPSECQ
jgi:AraC-like DNA-binding protein